jgi:steroid delta-isomerase-like uncharacterized protein
MLDVLTVCSGRVDMALTKFEAGWNGRSGESVAEAYAPDAVRIEYALPGARLEGREAIAAHTQNYIHAVPDCVLETVRETRGQDGSVTLEWVWRGTHTGELPNLPALGAKVELHGVSVFEMEGDLIKHERVYWDGATLLAGAGVLG